MAETINALNLNIRAQDDFSATLNKLSSSLDVIGNKGRRATSNLRNLNNALNELASSSSNIGVNLSEINSNLNSIGTSSKTASEGVKNLGTVSTKTSTQVSGLSGSIGAVSSAMAGALVKVWALIGGFRGLVSFLGTCISTSMEYYETLNLFTVSMGEGADNAQRFAESVSEVYGINPADWMRYQGTFEAIIRGFGVGAEQATYMSQNLTQLGYDLASFENSDVDAAMLKIQSGLAGEIEPMRRWGYDLSQAELTRLAQDPTTYASMTYTIDEETGAIEAHAEALYDDNEAIVANFNELSQLDKVQLRYIDIMSEMPYVHNDLARSLEDPANQLRILKNQFDLVKLEIGNAFIPVVNKVLPYLIALLQVLRQIISEIARFFGYELPDMSDRTSVEGSVSGYEDIEDAMDGASASAKKLRDYTIGIDELNVLRPNDNTGGSASVNTSYASGNQYDLTGYDFLGDAVSERVDKIRKQMEDFLEYEKRELKALRDSVNLIFDDVFKFFKNFKNLEPIDMADKIIGIGGGIGGYLLYDLFDGKPIEGLIKLKLNVDNFFANVSTGLLPIIRWLLKGDNLTRTIDVSMNFLNVPTILANWDKSFFGGNIVNEVVLNMSDRFKTELAEMFDRIVRAIGNALASIGEFLHIDTLVDLGEELVDGVNDRGSGGGSGGLGKDLRTIINDARNPQGNHSNSSSGLSGLVFRHQNAKRDARAYVNDFVDEIESNKARFEETGNNIVTSLNKPFNGVGTNIATSLVYSFADGIGTSKGRVESSANELRSSTVNTLRSNLYNRLFEAGEYGANGFADAFVRSSAYNNAMNNAKAIVDATVNSIKASISSLGSIVATSTPTTTSGNAVTKISENAVSNASALGASVGVAISTGISTGVNKTANTVANTGTRLAGNLISSTKGKLGIHSPSKVFMELGEYTAEGFTIGFEDEAKNAYKAVNDFASTISNVDTSMTYKVSTNGGTIQSPATAVSGVQAESMSNMAMLVYEAVNTALQSNQSNDTTQGDTKIYINGREIFKVVQEESRKNGVAISNGAFVGG